MFPLKLNYISQILMNLSVCDSAAAMNYLNTKFQTEILTQYAGAATLAEEALTGVRIVNSLNAQGKTSNRYKARLGGARIAGIKKSMVMGAGLGIVMCVIYLMYALAFWFGAQLLSSGQISSGMYIKPSN